MLELLNDSELEQVSGGMAEKDSEIHIVQNGETLAVIAAGLGTTVTVLMSINPQLKNPEQIRPGTRILVPKKS